MHEQCHTGASQLDRHYNVAQTARHTQPCSDAVRSDVPVVGHASLQWDDAENASALQFAAPPLRPRGAMPEPRAVTQWPAATFAVQPAREQPLAHMRDNGASGQSRRAQPDSHMRSAACPATAHVRPRSTRLLAHSGCAERLEAMDQLAQAVRERSLGAADAEISNHGMRQNECGTNARSGCADRYDAHVGNLLDKRRQRSCGRAGSGNESRRPMHKRSAARSHGTPLTGVETIERSSSRLQRQAEAFRALEGYERQMAAELMVLQRSLRM